MRHILVTGGGGFIGGALCQALLANGARVSVIDDFSSGSRERVPAGVSVVEGSILQPELIQASMAQADAVVHLAAIASVPVCQADPVGSHMVNQSAFVRMLEIAARAKHTRDVPVVYASSAAVYGDPGRSDFIAEDHPKRPISNYGADKLGLELQSYAAFKMWGVGSIGLRFFNVYGPGQRADSPYSGVISRFLRDLRERQAVTIFGDGKQSRDFVHVDDVVQAILKAIVRAPGRAEAFNVCTGKETNLLQLQTVLAELLAIPARIDFAPARTGDILRSVGAGGHAAEALDFRARIELREGLRSLVEATAD